MRLPISPITVDDTVCTEAEVSAAISSSVAIRVVPVDADGVEHPNGALGVVGTADQPDVAAYLEAVTAATANLLTGRGI